MPSSAPSDLGDAIRPNGTLKDVSEMMWSYDADDTIPFPTDNAVDSNPAAGLLLRLSLARPRIPHRTTTRKEYITSKDAHVILHVTVRGWKIR